MHLAGAFRRTLCASPCQVLWIGMYPYTYSLCTYKLGFFSIQGPYNGLVRGVIYVPFVEILRRGRLYESGMGLLCLLLFGFCQLITIISLVSFLLTEKY